MSTHNWSRRQFMTTSAGLLAAWGVPQFSYAGSRPKVTNPRATSGDAKHEPNWQEKLTITVGAKKGDIVGNTDRALQAAIDYTARLGGGTVKILPGTYTLRASLWLPSNLRLLGSGAETIITKQASITTKLAADSDWYDQEIRLANPKGFQLGDSIVLTTRNTQGGKDVLKRRLVAKSGNRFKLDRALRKNFWVSGNPTASTLFPLLTSEYTADVVIENLTLDGNRKNNANLNGNYGGGIFIQDCNRYTVRDVTIQNYNGDGVSWQICHDVVVENCRSINNANLGLHPGSGSQRPLIRKNKISGAQQGIFFCWGVKYGLAEENEITGNSLYGISIGHCDTDNVVRNNVIKQSGQVGLLFRDDARGQDFWGNRNLIERNQIINSGGAEGLGIDIRGKTKDTRLVGNIIKETRKPEKRIGIRIGKNAGRVMLKANSIEGVAIQVEKL